MLHKTFISYKYSESQELRDKIINRLGESANYYKGETSESPDLTNLTTLTIKRKLSDMIYDTSVLIVIVSPNMLKSKWMEWEINYAFNTETREGRTSQRNGIVCVVKKDYGHYHSAFANAHYGYAWAQTYNGEWDKNKLFKIINENTNNALIKRWLFNGYIDIVKEEDFLNNTNHYIDLAYDKSKNLTWFDFK